MPNRPYFLFCRIPAVDEFYVSFVPSYVSPIRNQFLFLVSESKKEFEDEAVSCSERKSQELLRIAILFLGSQKRSGNLSDNRLLPIRVRATVNDRTDSRS